MALEVILYVGLAVVLHFVIEYFRRKPQIDNISSKSVLITGCDTGFGNLLAKRLDGLGCRVFAACYTQKGADELRSCSSSRLETVLLDVTKTDSIKKAEEFVAEKLGPNQGLWGLVNNAGIAFPLHVFPEYMNRQDFKGVLDVNLLGMVDVSLHFLPLLVKSKGRIVNMASAVGRLSLPFSLPYNLSKIGVESFSDGIRPYMKQYGVHVAMVEPGAYATPLMNEDLSRERIQKGYERLPDEDQAALGGDYVDKIMGLVLPFIKGANKNLDEVVDAYLHGLFAVNPKKRYTCGWDCRLFIIPVSYMPSWVQDYLSRVMNKSFMPPVPLSKFRQQTSSKYY